MRSFTILATLLAAITSVAAHGYVQGVTADGQTESGFLPFADLYQNPVPARVIRNIPSDGPVMDITSPNIACNQGGNNGTSKVLDVNAGSDMTFKWTNWPSDHQGPVTTLMASCNGDCSTFTATDGKWFKISEGGYSNGQWASQKLIAAGNQWTSNIPAGLSSGQYLVRHEIVALHSVTPQFYPSCTQVNVKNGGADKPSTTDLTTFPGMYKDFKWPNIWTDSLDGFVVAGPRVVSFADNDSPDPAPSSSPSSSPSSVPSYSVPLDPSGPSSTVPLSTPANPNSSGPSSTVPSSTPANPNSFGPSSTVLSITPANPNSSGPSSTVIPSTPANATNTSVCRTKRRSIKRSVSGRHVYRRSTHH